MNDMKDEIQKLKHGECYTVPESDYGKAEIWRLNGAYIVFSIPMYGGDPQIETTFLVTGIDHMIDYINSWT